ncbi:unnamed protein product [Cladocopium goreaui]|uniref:Pentatricopeptide repeat-containing protein At1g05670, mitochondrial n=1 Tax=Cladocopium goreaui TaxID=2562237 RepID=A0A9P1FXV8_9DINO|nr:unnamed protein product [Cladocopium goreaui]
MAEVEGKGDFYGFNPGQKLVLKFIKAKKYNSGVRITEKDVAAQKLAQQYAKAFKEKHRPVRGKEPLDLFFRIATLISSSKDQLDGTVRKILEDELMMVELPIYGEFKKFNSNTGWSSGEGNLPGAFSHWTWVESNGKHLICDLQGHRGLPGGTKTTDGSSNYYAFSDPAVLSKVSGSYGPADLGEEGQKTWFSHHVCNDFCKSLGLEGKVSYNSVINACAQTGYVERAEMWLGRMLEAGVQANEVSYNSVINACAQKGRVSRAEMWLEKMLAAGVKTDAFSYNSVINACAQRRDIERAETWLEKMLSEGIQADEVSYSSVIKACVQKGELDLAGYWLERMAAAGLQANEVTYNTVAGACLAAGDKDRLERWRKLMRLEENTVLKDPPLLKPSRPSSCTTKSLDDVDQDWTAPVNMEDLLNVQKNLETFVQFC